MSPTQNKKEKTEREKMMEALREQIAKAESKGLYDTAHHQMLRQMTEKPKEQKDGE